VRKDCNYSKFAAAWISSYRCHSYRNSKCPAKAKICTHLKESLDNDQSLESNGNTSSSVNTIPSSWVCENPEIKIPHGLCVEKNGVWKRKLATTTATSYSSDNPKDSLLVPEEGNSKNDNNNSIIVDISQEQRLLVQELALNRLDMHAEAIGMEVYKIFTEKYAGML
jgi:hypothetical protein